MSKAIAVYEKVRKSSITAMLLEVVTILPATMTRLVLGWGFYWTGSGKIKNIENIIEFFRTLGIPYPEYQAPFVARLEYYGALLLLVGFATRPTAFLLASTMVVALLTADKADFLATWNSSSEKMPVEITAFAYLLLLLWLMVRGGGLLSLDAMIGWVYSKMVARQEQSTDENL